ncbi:MAG TPA: succinate dehydrogenase, cytochrome b556 subunit [Longimicrobiaceae bacterium]|nr:succinate dehydrogenase, cytochrome b556 subunit [Longimicrobiaceae bacterium]
MANARNTSLGTSLRYRGREGMWTWILHRVTGLGILLFLLIHVVETATVIYYPEVYDGFLASYKTGLFRFAELVIFFSVLFHAVNGLRIVVQDFWPYVMQRQRQLVWASAAVVVLAMLPITWIMLAPIFGLAEEPGVERHQLRCAETPDAPACREEAVHGSGEVAL